MNKEIFDLEYTKGQKLDLYMPDDKPKGVIVWFHGGGIENGDKRDDGTANFVKQLVDLGYAGVSANYSMYPNTKFPEYLYQAAQAVKYIFDHADEYGYPKNIFVGGQSAGAYITMMLNMNKEYLSSVGLNPLDIAGWISDAGQMSDHFNVMKYERGCNPWLQRITELSPLFYVDENVKTTPILLTCYEQDMLCRVEQNILFEKSIHFFNNEAKIELHKLKGSHCAGSIIKDDDGLYPVIKLVKTWLKNNY